MLQKTGVTQALARVVVATRWEDIPSAVRHQAKRSLMNFFAVALVGCRTSPIETAIRSLADFSYPIADVAAPISSGSFKTVGMVIAPCSMRSLAEIATGVTTTLLTRAADVVLKERGRLVLMVRETPLHTGHLRNMLALSEMGAVIAPPVPAFYSQPETIDEMVDHSVGRLLDLFGLETGTVRRWGEARADRAVSLPAPRRQKA